MLNAMRAAVTPPPELMATPPTLAPPLNPDACPKKATHPNMTAMEVITNPPSA
jgi:hypothetical protein